MTHNPTELLMSKLSDNRINIIAAMNAAISATENSFYPFGRKEKIEALTKLRKNFEENTNPDDVINFIILSSKNRSFFQIFFSSTSSFRALQKSFLGFDFLTNLLNIMQSSKEIDEIKLQWGQSIKVIKPIDEFTLSLPEDESSFTEDLSISSTIPSYFF